MKLIIQFGETVLYRFSYCSYNNHKKTLISSLKRKITQPSVEKTIIVKIMKYVENKTDILICF